MAETNVKELPEKTVGPVSCVHVFPSVSVTPPMLTGRPFQGVLVETKATSVEAPVELKAVDVCVVSAVPLM